MATEIKFIADCMLGKLGRWLRVCGFDTFYSRRIKDSDLLVKAQAEDRVVLTRDHALFNLCPKKNLQALLILYDLSEEQLKQVFRELNLQPPSLILRRCLECNEILHQVEKSEIEDRVPAYIFDTVRKFYVCPICHKVFWPGSHWLNMKNKLEQLFG